MYIAAMSCTDCTECNKITAKMPDCYTGTINMGIIALSAPVVIRATKISTGATTEYDTAADGIGVVSFTLADFDADAGFFSSHAGLYKFEGINPNSGEAYELDDGGAVTDAVCLLVEFTPGDNFNSPITWTYVA